MLSFLELLAFFVVFFFVCGIFSTIFMMTVDFTTAVIAKILNR